MMWILLLWCFSSLTTAEFTSQEKCEAAYTTADNVWHSNISAHLNHVCVPK